MSVNVVESDEAYVGVSACEKSNGNDKGAEPVWVVVTNQFIDTFVVEDVSWDDLQNEPVLQPGESTTFKNAFANRSDGTVAVEVAGGLDATVTVDVTEKGECEMDKKWTNDKDGKDDKREKGKEDEEDEEGEQDD